jgi:hypothetical protein
VAASFHVRADILQYGFKILLARGVDGGAAGKGIGGFRFLRRENHRESKN